MHTHGTFLFYLAEKFLRMDFESIFNTAKSTIVNYGFNLVAAILTLIIGLWVVKRLSNFVRKQLEKSKIDDSLVPFLSSLHNVLLKTILVITVLSTLGIEMTSLVAILGAAGLAVGMALSGTLQNFAGGVMILIFKPFKVGDYINAQGHSGSVKEIQIFNTILTTPDNKTIIIPNGGLSTSSMTNFSAQDKRRVDWTFGVGYGDDIKLTKEILLKLANDDSRILNDPAEPFVALSELADSSVNFVLRCWVNPKDYWPVYFEMNENVYNSFKEAGLNIPYPQMDVHISKDL